MYIKKLIYSSNAFLGLFLLLTVSCQRNYDFSIDAPDKININQPLNISIKDKHNHQYDSVNVFLGNLKIDNLTDIDLSQEKLGRRIIKANIFYDGQSKTIIKPIMLLAAQSPKIYDYKIINTFPHDTKAYTQGLEFHNGILYESTGQHGESSLRKVDYKTGHIIQKIDLPRQYFAEGITIFDKNIFQLTWQSQLGFIYNLNNFKKTDSFAFKKSKEGWGLTHSPKHLIKTDGTEKVWFLDPKTQEELYYIEAYTNKQKVTNLNELEYINGKVYANVYQKNIILILNPNNGAIEGIVDLNKLEKEMLLTQRLTPQDEVLNGIAFDQEHNRIFITGKRWSKLFEIEIFERP